MAELSVQIGADVRDLLKKLDLTEAQLKRLGSLSKKAGSDIQQVGTVGAKGMNALGKSTSNAVPALTSFSQVIQDAPYGIRGVANNITQLTSQFGYLSASAGGAKGAIKAMLGTLAGPAGILLAVSAVTSILVSYGDEIGNIISGNNALSASQKEVTKALNDFYGGTATKINTYVSILEDVNTKEDDRLRITDELIKLVPSLTKADFNYGNNLDLVKAKIGSYVLAQASRIEADKLVELNSDRLAKKAAINRIKSIQDETERVDAIKKLLKEEGESLKTSKGVEFSSLYGNTGGRDKNTKEIIADFNSFVSQLDNELKPIEDKLKDLYGTTFSGGLDKATEESPLKEVKGKIVKQIVRDFQGITNELQSQGIAGNDLQITAPQLVLPKVADEAFLQSLINARTQADILTNAIGSSFSALANEISSNLTTGVAVVDAFVSSIIQSLTQMLAQMVTQAITQAIVGNALATASGIAAQAQGVQIATQAAAALGPFGLPALPGLLAATQGMITGALAIAKIPKFAKGGYSGDNNLAYLNKNELVLRPFEQSMLLNALRGSGIPNNARSESSSSGIVGELQLRGQNQVVQLRRAERNMKRYYNN